MLTLLNLVALPNTYTTGCKPLVLGVSGVRGYYYSKPSVVLFVGAWAYRLVACS